MALTAILEPPSIQQLSAPAKAAYYALQSLETNVVLDLVTTTIRSRIDSASAAQISSLMDARGEAAKPLVEQRSGVSLSTAEAAQRLRTSDETIRKRIDRGQYIAYPDLSERKRLRLPQWQFSSPTTVHPWVATLIESFGGNGWALIDFLTVPRSGEVGGKIFQGESFLSELQAGNVQRVLDVARRANPE